MGWGGIITSKQETAQQYAQTNSTQPINKAQFQPRLFSAMTGGLM